MANYLITYIGGNPPATREEGMAHMGKFREWLGSLGDAVISPANPLSKTHTVGPDGSVTEGGSSGMSGYTTVAADSIEAAVAIAKGCPFLDIGGKLEVSELMAMPGGQ